MKKHTIVFVLLLVIAFSCKEKRIDNLNAIPELKYFLDSFIRDGVNIKYIHEIYIDKLSPEETNFYIYEGQIPLMTFEHTTKKIFSNWIYIYKGVEFKIFCGIEKYFFIDSSKYEVNRDYRQNSSDKFAIREKDFRPFVNKLWLIKDDGDHIFFVQNDKNIFPFFFK